MENNATKQNKINIINVFAKYMIMSFSCFAYIVKVLFSIYIHIYIYSNLLVQFCFFSFGSCCFRYFSVWLPFSSLSCVSLLFSLSPSLSMCCCLPYFLTLLFLSYFLPFPLCCCFFRCRSTFLWFFLSFFCVLSLASSLDRSFSSSYSLLVLTSYLQHNHPHPPRCSFRIAFSLVFCDFLQCNCS